MNNEAGTSVVDSESTIWRRLIGAGRGFWKRWDAYIVAVLLLVTVLLVWQWASGSGNLIHPVILPQPSAIGEAIGYLCSSGFFVKHTLITIGEIFAGFGLSIAAGMLLGMAVAMQPVARRVLYPYIIMFQAIPKVAFIPLFMTWFGFGATSKIAVAAAIGFFPTFVNTIAGMSGVSEEGVRLMYSLGASRWQHFRMFQFPNALPSIIAGVNISLTFAIVGVVVAEFSGARLGLGFLIEVFSFQLNIARAFAVVVLLSILSFVIYYAIERLGHRLVFWIQEEGKARGGL